MPPSRENFQRRRDQVRKLLRSRKLDGLLVNSEKNVAWLTGFTGDSSWLLMTADSEVLLSDSRFTTQIEEECPGLHSSIRNTTQKLTEILSETAQKLGIERCGFEAHHITVDISQTLFSLSHPVSWDAQTGLIEQLRAIKDKFEIAEIREAIRFAERGFEVLKSILTPEKTERQLAAELEHAMRGFGAVGCSFPPIIAVGDRAALPHYRAGARKIKDSPILLCDWGAKGYGGYCSDLTRTILTSKSDKTFEKVYKTVLEAQLAAISIIAPGVAASEVDEAARQVIRKAGYGKHFGHGLGHGIGLDVHESIRLAPHSLDVLKPGMVVTVEPGIYLPGWGGVRIEDDILVTRQGAEVLSSVTKDWENVTVAC